MRSNERRRIIVASRFERNSRAGQTGMITPDSVYLFKDARKVGDAKVVDACWREILRWPAETVLTYHDPPGYGFQGDGRAALEAAARRARQIA